MDLEILLFGVVKEMVGQSKLKVTLQPAATVQDLKTHLHNKYPESKKLKSLLIAINECYAGDDEKIGQGDTIAIIPPVSGG